MEGHSTCPVTLSLHAVTSRSRRSETVAATLLPPPVTAMEGLQWLNSEELFLEHLRKLGKVGSSLPLGSHVEAVVEGCKGHLQQRFLEHQVAGYGQPLLRWYSSDCTPVRILRSATHQTSSGPAKRRRKTGEEFLVQLLYQRRIIGHNCTDSLLFAEPQQLDHGKTAAALFACGQKTFGHLVPRLADHGALCVFFSSFDRLCFVPLAKSFAGLAKEQWIQGLDSELHDLAPLADELLWCVSSPCALHDCHNACKWGIGAVFANSDLWKQLYVAVVSCRAMSFEVAEGLSSWLNSVISFVDDDVLPSTNFLYDYYGVVGCLCGSL